MAFLFYFNCYEPLCWFYCPHSLFVSSLSSGLAILFFHSALYFSFYLVFWNFSLCDQLFLFLLTTLWRMGCLHISYIALETDLSLDQTVVGSRLVSLWMCEVSNAGSATTRILLWRTFIWNCDLALWVNWILLSWWTFHCRRIIYENLNNILEERLKCSKTQCFRTVSISDNEMVIIFSWFFYFLKDK